MNDAFRQLPRILEGIEHLDMTYFSCEADCGTTYCLAGACAFDPWMLKNTNILELFVVSDDGKQFSRAPHVEKLSQFFDISLRDCATLFFTIAKPTKEHVLTNINLILNNERPISYARMRQLEQTGVHDQ